MNSKFDELAKGLAQSTTRPQVLKKFGVGLACLAIAAVAPAQTSPPKGQQIQSLAAGLAVFVGPSEPTNLYFNAIHAYTPADICAAYGVEALHNAGWTGKGQTIVLVDSYGSPTALQDLQTFSTAFGLSAPDLTIIYPDGQPTLNSSDKLSSAIETSLDLQWAHAIAPDAKLVLIAANPAETDGSTAFPACSKASNSPYQITRARRSARALALPNKPSAAQPMSNWQSTRLFTSRRCRSAAHLWPVPGIGAPPISPSKPGVTTGAVPPRTIILTRQSFGRPRRLRSPPWAGPGCSITGAGTHKPISWPILR